MIAFRRPALLAAAFVASTSAVAGAQAKCDINEGSPFQLNSAKIYLGKAQGSGAADEKPKHLRNAVQVLTEKADKIGNPVGRNWLLAKTLFEWTKQKSVDSSLVVQRGLLGYTENPGGTIDMVAAIDSALTVVEQSSPGCAAQTIVYRKNVWVPMYNRALALFNAGQTDAAQTLLQRAVVIEPRNANTYNLLSLVAEKKGDTTAMLSSYGKVVEISTGDTSYAKIRKVALYNEAVLVQNQAANATGAKKTELAQQSIGLWRTYTKEFPADVSGQTGLTQSLRLSGDTAAVMNIYEAMLADPSKYTDIQLFEAGTNAIVAHKEADAVKLLEAGLAMSPNYRDALFNLANAYRGLEQPDKMLPVARSLVAVDPNNGDNWRLLAAAYQIQAKRATDDKTKRALNDSTIKYVEKSNKTLVRVSFNQFMHNGAKHTLAGTVQNKGTAPGTYTLKFEFLDKTGSVVATQSATVGPVEPNQSKDFTVSVTQTGIVAYRYAPIM